ncbi:MAG: HPr family phosphocarrier protein [Candidatus Omnitrophica bacterium]|nr:HPr family phosphocarrier protein [Candidatus Omnitrophota bacterium]MBU2044176.1 HPr family phosphocarrier protein [Candidatus Omnitrophota bacterium]MBU2251036.1 HPr family phosphocarrier protein [Candidatus Omnitrophota bacterium]MBU2473508.1 HPr family phosphocarrier protein [Candidatus Omnitrophota bacterium]
MERLEEQITVNKEHGLHARPATIFVQLANKFNSSIRLDKAGEAVDGKSIIAILSLGVNKGMQVNLIVEGSDSEEAMQELKKFLEAEDD